MIVKEYIKQFEKLGFGMFVHFGLYSVYGKGEWVRSLHEIPEEEYNKRLPEFCPEKDWAEKLVLAAKGAGCKYITLTTRHHDGFSLYDTCGLTEYDTVHTIGRDLVREYVDACNRHGIIPFFYHTLLDWHNRDYYDNFPEYLVYLRRSVEILCSKYGKIGGLWFDGMWAPNHTTEEWDEDALYGLIRSYQPDAMIINNTGMRNMGALGHPELDSVTFERGRPQPINMEGAPKYIASEMCEIFNCHWGYAAEDLRYRSVEEMIRTLCVCRRYGANFLLNVGPMGNGYLRNIDAAMLEMIGKWVDIYEESIRTPRPTGVEIEGKSDDFILRDGHTGYLFCHGLGIAGSGNVVKKEDVHFYDTFKAPFAVKSARWMDSDQPLEVTADGEKTTVFLTAFPYGTHHVVRVAKLELED